MKINLSKCEDSKKDNQLSGMLDLPKLELRSRASSYCMEMNQLPAQQLIGLNDFNEEYFQKKFKDLIKGKEIGRGKTH